MCAVVGGGDQEIEWGGGVETQDTLIELNAAKNVESNLEDGSASNATLHVIYLRSRLVDVEGPNHNHLGRRGEVPV